jgi:uncharacterized delta-60 repeat protein
MRTRVQLGVLAAGAATLIATVTAAAVPAQAASAGSLDPTWGTGGVVTVPAGFSTGDMLTLPDGTILDVGGETNATTGDAEFAILSYNENGTVDTSFGTDGLAVASFPGVSVGSASVFVQPDGNIVLAGITEEGDPEVAIAEFNANGTLDTSFGSGGEVTDLFPSGNPDFPGTDSVNAVLVDANGNILVGGGLVTCSNPQNAACLSEYALARFTPDGALDTSFGNGGSVVQKAGSHSNGVIALGEDSAGDIFVQYNNVSDTIGDSQPTVGEYSPAGVPDSTVTFPSSSSIVISSETSSSYGFQPNGTYPVGQMVQKDVGSRQTYDVQVLLDSLPSGTPSASFNNPPFAYASGVVANTIQGSSPIAEPDGDVVLDGWTCVLYKHGVCQDGAPYLARLTPTGSLDSTFGTGGIAPIPISSSGATNVASPSIQPDGDIFVPIQNFVTNAQGITTTTTTIDRFLG